MNRTKKKILVVDDTDGTRYAVARTLKAEGYDVIEAATGLGAISLMATEKPDMVTLDIHLPDISGFEVCRRIKANPGTAHVPILQVSASYVSSKDRIFGLEGGADSYLTHPFEPPVLAATVKALLRGSQLHEDLRLSEERFRVALKYAPITIYMTDLDLRYTWIYNSPAGLNPADFIGRKDAEIFSSAEAKVLDEIKVEVLKTGAGQRLITTLKLQNYTHCYDLTIEPLRSSEGEIEGLTIASIDVTERMLAEEAQKKALEAAEQANQAKTRFLSNMSHEIRTPLGVIQGFADLALDSSISASERGDYLHTIKRNAQNLTKLLGEILDLAKIEAGRVELEKTRFSLPDLVSEVVAAMNLQAREKGVHLKFEIRGPFPEFVRTDATRLRQVLINLVSNALKFTEKGSVDIHAEVLPRTSETEPVFIEFTVRDTGIGLSPDQQLRLFEAFMQADNSTTRKFGGTGLGLNLSKKLIQSLGGDLTLEESSVGRGSSFRFTFDAGVLSSQDFAARFKMREDTPEKKSPRFADELKGLTVLLVEDSVDNQVLFTHYLRNMGVKVDLASDGFEGVQKAQSFAYDAILMDVQMPNLDGYDATKILRTGGLKTPIVALTAHAFKEERERALLLGFSEYLTKPLNPAILVATLKPYLPGHIGKKTTLPPT